MESEYLTDEIMEWASKSESPKVRASLQIMYKWNDKAEAHLGEYEACNRSKEAWARTIAEEYKKEMR